MNRMSIISVPLMHTCIGIRRKEGRELLEKWNRNRSERLSSLDRIGRKSVSVFIIGIRFRFIPWLST